MNEAFSDIFGEAVEAFALGDTDWLIGSQLGTDRSSHPRHGDPRPARLSGALRAILVRRSTLDVRNRDNGGVHINSGIINHAFYLLAEGLDGAIGLRDAERIFYRALAFHLVANSQFIDARLACLAAAAELFGADSRRRADRRRRSTRSRSSTAAARRRRRRSRRRR